MQLVKDSAKVYQLGILYVTPYPTESLLASAYLKMEAQGLLDVCLHEGVKSISWWLGEFAQKNAILACWVKTRDTGSIDKDLDLAGLAWFNNRWKIGESGKTKAEAGYVFFKEHQTPKKTLPLAAMCLEWAFSHLGVDLVLGMTPEKNKLACYFLRWLGMKASGPLENFTTYPAGGEVCGAYISTMTGDRWQVVKNKWFDAIVDNSK